MQLVKQLDLIVLTCAVGVSVEVQPMDQFVSVGDMVHLTCNVSGSEPIYYQWLKDGRQLQDDRMVSGSNASVLMFTVSFSSFGEYQCNASNDVNHVLSEVAVVHGEGSGRVYMYIAMTCVGACTSTSASVLVLCSLTFSSFSAICHILVSPEDSVIVIPFSIQTLSVNGSVTFTCMAQGGPSNVFQWSLNGVAGI